MPRGWGGGDVSQKLEIPVWGSQKEGLSCTGVPFWVSPGTATLHALNREISTVTKQLISTLDLDVHPKS